MERTEKTAHLFHRAQELAYDLGLDLEEALVGGGSDGNFCAALGVPVLDGLGAVGGGAHARQEHVLVDAMPLRAALVTRLLETV
jgi:glutamate carboxypeptidase